jgi:hypothetical protein
MIKCPKCDSINTIALLHVLIAVEAKYARKLTKQVLRERTSELWATSHDKTRFRCVDCNYHWQ